jgi:hypothetical protein
MILRQGGQPRHPGADRRFARGEESLPAWILASRINTGTINKASVSLAGAMEGQSMSLSHQDIVEINQVQALYGHAVDWPDQTLLPKVFTADAVFDGRPCGGPAVLYLGDYDYVMERTAQGWRITRRVVTTRDPDVTFV